MLERVSQCATAISRHIFDCIHMGEGGQQAIDANWF